MKRIAAFIVSLILVIGTIGCSNLLSNKTANTAVKWGNRGIALAQCAQEAIETANPEAATQQCVTQWLPELPPDATAIAADYARCMRVGWQATAPLAKEQRQAQRIQMAADCTAQYGPKLFEAVQVALK